MKYVPILVLGILSFVAITAMYLSDVYQELVYYALAVVIGIMCAELAKKVDSN